MLAPPAATGRAAHRRPTTGPIVTLSSDLGDSSTSAPRHSARWGTTTIRKATRFTVVSVQDTGHRRHVEHPGRL